MRLARLVLFVIHVFEAEARTPCLWNESVMAGIGTVPVESHCFITLESGSFSENPARQAFVLDRGNETYCCEFDGDQCCSDERKDDGPPHCCNSCCSMRRSCSVVCEMGSCQSQITCVQDLETSSNEADNYLDKDRSESTICGHRFRCCPGVLGEESEPDIETCGAMGFWIFMYIVSSLSICCFCACATCTCYRYRSKLQMLTQTRPTPQGQVAATYGR